MVNHLNRMHLLKICILKWLNCSIFFTIYIRPISCSITRTILRNKYLSTKVLVIKVTILVYSLNKEHFYKENNKMCTNITVLIKKCKATKKFLSEDTETVFHRPFFWCQGDIACWATGYFYLFRKLDLQNNGPFKVLFLI